MEHFKAIIIGSGQGGTPLAKKLAKAGWKTAIVEKNLLGGTCVNVGCTPTKTMIASARVAYLFSIAKCLGIDAPAHKVDITRVIERKNEVVEKFRGGTESGFEETVNLTVIYGEAEFLDNKSFTVKQKDGTAKEISGDLIFLDIGTRTSIPDIEGLDQVNYLTSTTILDLKVIPEHLIIVGSNYIGLEFGQMYKRFGSKVTLLEKGPRLLKKEDEDVAEEMTTILTEEGIEIICNAKPTNIKAEGAGFRLTINDGNGPRELEGSHLLIAAGRIPNTDQINIAGSGVELDEKGFIKVNGKLETSSPHVFAIGDVTGGPAFTHISYNDYIILTENLLESAGKSTEGRQVPYCMFTDPQLGRIGMNETEAQQKGLKFKVAKLPMSKVARAIESGETRGLMKAIVEEGSDQILGATVIGTEGGELMTMIQMAMKGKIPATELRKMIFAHPLFAESLNNLFLTLEK